MKITDLIQAAKDYVLTDEKISAMQQRAREAEARFEEESEARRFKPEDYDRYYSI